jgi:DNA-binding ferritin-like protein (Dps family)
MANKLDKLRQENNRLDKQLTKENHNIMIDMVCYLRSSDLSDYDIENIRKELTGMALEAQLRNENFKDVVGDDYQALCDALMKNGRQKTLYERTLEILSILVYGIGVLYLIEIFFSSTITDIFKFGQFTMPITSGFIISTIMAALMAFGTYHFLTKYSFEFSNHNRTIKALFFIGFTAAWTSILLIKVFMDNNVLLTINCIYPLVFFAGAYVVIKYFNDRYANSLFEANK